MQAFKCDGCGRLLEGSPHTGIIAPLTLGGRDVTLLIQVRSTSPPAPELCEPCILALATATLRETLIGPVPKLATQSKEGIPTTDKSKSKKVENPWG